MGGGVCDVPSAFALLVFLARSFRSFFRSFPQKKLMDYLGPRRPSPPRPNKNKKSTKNQVIRILQPLLRLLLMLWQLLLLLPP